jgi:hypothetical protein
MQSNRIRAMKKIGVPAITELLPRIEGKAFAPDVFAQSGLFIVRQAIPPAQLEEWRCAWDSFYTAELAGGANVSRFNPVSIDLQVPPVLAAIHQAPALLDIVEQAFGPDLALYNQRFVIKDKYRLGDIFVHSDYPYHHGWPNKASAFLALGPVNRDNGGMYFYPGTHQFGYLGDAGELDPTVLPAGWPVVSPSLEAGDVVFMHSATWHGSHPFSHGPDRILVDIIYQPADDPSGTALLRGQWQTELRMDMAMRSRLYKRSRATRLVELQKKLDAAEAALATQQGMQDSKPAGLEPTEE